MRLNEIQIIKEGYKEVKQKFLASNPDEQQDIEKYIEMFRDLVDRNQLQGSEKNIDYWGKQGYESSKEMVEYKSQQKSKTQVKRSKVKGESITLHEDDKWLVVIPLDKDASCFHGKNTDWCTAKPTQNYFDEYFYNEHATLIYFIRKKDLNKWAIIILDEGYNEYFDKNDNRIHVRKFNTQTGLSANKFIKMAKKKHNKIQPKRDEYEEYRQKVKDAIYRVKKGNHNYELEDALIKLPDRSLFNSYMTIVGQSSKYKKEFQLAAVAQDYIYIKYIENPDKDVQLAAVHHSNGRVIAKIENPDKDVQLAAVKENGYTIKYIKNPDKDVQIAAVTEDGWALELIKNPDRDVEIAAVTSNPNLIHILYNKPDKELQMVAVKTNPEIIDMISNPHPSVIKYVENLK